jgi:hypothetical protein
MNQPAVGGVTLREPSRDDRHRIEFQRRAAPPDRRRQERKLLRCATCRITAPLPCGYFDGVGALTRGLRTPVPTDRRSGPRSSVQPRSHMGAMNAKICRVTACGHERILTRPNQRWCSQSCRQRAYRERIKLLLKATQPARAVARFEMKMARGASG